MCRTISFQSKSAANNAFGTPLGILGPRELRDEHADCFNVDPVPGSQPIEESHTRSWIDSVAGRLYISHRKKRASNEHFKLLSSLGVTSHGSELLRVSRTGKRAYRTLSGDHISHRAWYAEGMRLPHNI